MEKDGMIYIPEGEFVMGSDEVDTEGMAKEFGDRKGVFYEDEKPVRKINLKAYYIDKYEVTMKAYKAFVDAVSYPPPSEWNGNNYPKGGENYPVLHISRFNANDYCKWAGKRLPSEEEWEKAARGPNGNRYSYGNDFDASKANLSGTQPSEVGSYETDKSYYGVYDMAGNMSEWVDAWYEPYPGSNHKHKDFGKTSRVLRGGAFLGGHYMMSRVDSRAAYRSYFRPDGYAVDTGFRCARDVEK